MRRHENEPFVVNREVRAVIVPAGQEVKLKPGQAGYITQALGGSFTVQTDQGHLARIDAHDADALGLDATQGDEEPADSGPFELQQVIEQLKTVFDPEIPVNVVDLGLIYACDARPLADGGHRVEIKMSMTAPGCGMGDVLKDD
ncbi:MAG TPA: iron-sulfur cluster assembly protein, partial [Steroidobacteraceae bacterium]|nr:iron-sulfur cluster assembly protein [Steroidobacteraceae bacterium]